MVMRGPLLFILLIAGLTVMLCANVNLWPVPHVITTTLNVACLTLAVAGPAVYVAARPRRGERTGGHAQHRA